MTEKERSEDMSKLDSIRSSLKCLELYEILSFVNEQAERVEKLLEQTGHNFEVNRKLDAQNKRYREAIDEALTEGDFEDGYNQFRTDNKHFKSSIGGIRMTVQALITFYEQKRQEYKDSIKEREEELTKGHLDEPDAYFVQKQLEMDRITIGIVNGFIENLKLLESESNE